ncbi:MAG: threonine-phosphate decarboxylase [Deltaproteobacteria bacterium]|nr:MAG: threonine-phosphate decarboxylase [Deltaproteobacteria bacterium]
MTSEEHIHGGDPERALRRLGVAPRDILDFSVNVSPLGVPQQVRAIWNDLWKEVESYPSVDGRGVVDYYCERFGIDPAQVLAGNGSTEFIYLAPRALGLRKVAVLIPSFHDYTRASVAAGAELMPVQLKAVDGFSPPDVSILGKALEQGDALFVGNPNNPTGTVFPRRVLLDLAAAFPHKWFFVDEAFVQFLDQPEAVSLLKQEPPPVNILIFHSLTKFFALPGLRLGAVIGHPDTISRLRPLKEPWSVNRIAEKVALELLSCFDYENRLTTLIRQERPRVFNLISGIAGFEVVKPSANFMLARWTRTPDLDDLLHFLLNSGIHLRDCRNFPGLEDNFFRMAVRLPEENDRVLSLMQSCADHHP